MDSARVSHIVKFLVLILVSMIALGSSCPSNPPSSDGGDSSNGDDSGQPTPGPDGGPPTALRAVATSNTTLRITFSEAMESDADGLGYYRIQPSLRISSASMNSDGTAVILTTAPQEDVEYTLILGDLMSASGVMLSADRRELRFFGIASDDETGPQVTETIALGNTQVLVAFSEPVDVDAERLSNYQITPVDDLTGIGELAVTNAMLRGGATEVVLTTRPQSAIEYRVEVNGVHDLLGNLILSSANSGTFMGVGPEDDEAPRVAGAISTGNTGVLVTFSEAMGDSALATGNYLVGTKSLSQNLLDCR